MPFSRFAALLSLPFAVTTAFAQITVSGDLSKPITIRVTRPERLQPIPATVFGSFLEPIGKSTYGGLWADVLENPSFENGMWSVEQTDRLVRERPNLRRASALGLPIPWEPLTDQGARYLPVIGDAANSSASVEIMSLPGKQTGVRELVYLPVQRELTYTASVYLKHISGPADVTLSILPRDRAGQTLASARIDAAATEWKKYTVTLTLAADSVYPLQPLDFAIATGNDGRVLVDQASLMPADNLDGLDPDEVAMARDLQSPIIRFGGNFTSAYDWHDGVGPRDKRVSKLNVSWGIPEYNTFGTDEFLHFCRLIHAEPQVALNLGTGTPEQAAEWVRYIDDQWPDAKGAHKGGLLWELGNELWGDFQVGYPSLERVAAKTLATSEAIRKVDPHARLIATGADEDHFTDWNAAQLSNPPGTFDSLSTHFVVGASTVLRQPTAAFTSEAALAMPFGLAKQMRAIQGQIDGTAHKGKVHVAFTEWLMHAPNSGDVPSFQNQGGALFAAGFLNMILRNSDIVPISDMTGIMEFGGIWKKRGVVYGAPAYWVLREYASAHPTALLAVTNSSPTYTVAKGITRLPEIADVPYLDVTAAIAGDGKTLVLFCLNRNLDRPLAAEIDLGIFGATGPAEVRTLAADSLSASNDEEQPERVHPVITTEPATGTLHHVFPSKSVTVIRIPLAK